MKDLNQTEVGFRLDVPLLGSHRRSSGFISADLRALLEIDVRCVARHRLAEGRQTVVRVS